MDEIQFQLVTIKLNMYVRVRMAWVHRKANEHSWSHPINDQNRKQHSLTWLDGYDCVTKKHVGAGVSICCAAYDYIFIYFLIRWSTLLCACWRSKRIYNDGIGIYSVCLMIIHTSTGFMMHASQLLKLVHSHY